LPACGHSDGTTGVAATMVALQGPGASGGPLSGQLVSRRNKVLEILAILQHCGHNCSSEHVVSVIFGPRQGASRRASRSAPLAELSLLALLCALLPLAFLCPQ
jgi:hypothetical protein